MRVSIKTQLVVACGALAAIAASSSTVEAQNSIHSLRVSRHVNTTRPSNSVVNSGFTTATNALMTDSGANDVACPVQLQTLDRTAFSGAGTTSNITTQAQYQATQNHQWSGYMAYVETLGWCGSTGNFGGCGWPIGADQPFVLQRATGTATARGIVFAHEFGHTVGLSHDNTGQQIMASGVLTLSNTKVLNGDACLPLQHGPAYDTCDPEGRYCTEDTISALAANSTSMPTSGISAQESMHGASDFSGVPIEELALGVIVDTMPVGVEDYYGQEDVDILKQMLADADMKDHHQTIVTLIGLISSGSDSDLDALEDYFTSLSDKWQKRGVGIAIGYVASRTGSSRAVDFLLDGLDDDTTADSVVAGLGVSGEARALAKLRAREVSARGLEHAVVAQAIADNTRVQAQGLRGFYGVQ